VPLAEGTDVVFEDEEMPSTTEVDPDGNPTNPTHPSHPSHAAPTERNIPISTTLVEKDVPTETGSNPFGVSIVHMGEETEEPTTKKRAL
jgi:hypothetical protein